MFVYKYSESKSREEWSTVERMFRSESTIKMAQSASMRTHQNPH